MIWNRQIKIDTRCEVCNTHLAGYRLNERSGKYYCEDHFQKTSPEEQMANKVQLKKGEDIINLDKRLI